ncbi:hypothetical protein FQZ97_838480 [compost metagenome]
MSASSVAAACSSKLKLRQKRLRNARPQARLSRLPNGEWMISCMPPDSSKKRSITRRCWVGKAPSAACARARYSTICRAAASLRPIPSRRPRIARSMASPRSGCSPLPPGEGLGVRDA